MHRLRPRLLHLAILGLLTMAPFAHAETPPQVLANYEAAGRIQAPTFSASATRGGEFFRSRHGKEWSCSSCHADTPTSPGKHIVTGKTIAPMAVAANPERLTRMEKIEKWFGRNCKDVLGRKCTAAEKADVVAFLITAK